MLGGKRIFIVEDSGGNLAIARILLESYGAIVKFERRGLNVSELILKQMPIDIILMDLMLPNKVSGFDIVDEIRSVPELAKIPIVAISAADPDASMPVAREKGLAGFISKPITPLIAYHIAKVISGIPVWIGDSRF